MTYINVFSGTLNPALQLQLGLSKGNRDICKRRVFGIKPGGRPFTTLHASQYIVQ